MLGSLTAVFHALQTACFRRRSDASVPGVDTDETLAACFCYREQWEPRCRVANVVGKSSVSGEGPSARPGGPVSRSNYSSMWL